MYGSSFPFPLRPVPEETLSAKNTSCSTAYSRPSKLSCPCLPSPVALQPSCCDRLLHFTTESGVPLTCPVCPLYRAELQQQCITAVFIRHKRRAGTTQRRTHRSVQSAQYLDCTSTEIRYYGGIYLKHRNTVPRQSRRAGLSAGHMHRCIRSHSSGAADHGGSRGGDCGLGRKC